MPGERVIFQRVLHLRSQAVEAATHICDASDDPDSGTGWQRYHRSIPFISRISARNISGVRGSNSFTTPDLRCSSHRGTFPGSHSGHSSGLLRQKGFVTGLVSYRRISQSRRGQACIPVCHHRSVSRPRTGFSI